MIATPPAQTPPLAAPGTHTRNVVVVGAGPAGAACAARLAQLGVKDVLLCDRHTFPRDKTCGSGVSPGGIATLRELGAWHDIAPSAYPIHGLRLVTPLGREAWLSGGQKTASIVCERRVLDDILVRHATAAGAELAAPYDAIDVLRHGGRAVGVLGRGGAEIRARVVVVAGGSHCRLGVAREQPRQTLQAIMGWWSGVSFRSGHVEMIFDETLRPYYGWLFPEDPDRVNIGITYADRAGSRRRNARDMFRTFLDRHFGARLSGATLRRPWAGHPIVTSDAFAPLAHPGLLVTGEAGLLTHPATGEGIYQALWSGMRAADAIHDVLVRGRSEHDAWTGYERACQRQFRAAFLAGRAFLGMMRTPALDWMVRAGQSRAAGRLASKLFAPR